MKIAQKNSDVEMLQPNEQEMFKVNFQSYFYLLNAKPDCKSKAYN